MAETVQMNIRVKPETIEQFRKFCNQNSLSNQKGLETLLESFALDQIKDELPAQKEAIENIDYSFKELRSLLIYGFKNAKNTEDRHKQQLEEAKEAYNLLVEELQSKSTMLEEVKKEANSAKEQAKSNIQFIDKLQSTIDELEEKLKVSTNKASKFDEMQLALEKEQQISKNLVTRHELELQKLTSDKQLALANQEKEFLGKIGELEKELAALKTEKEFRTNEKHLISPDEIHCHNS